MTKRRFKICIVSPHTFHFLQRRTFNHFTHKKLCTMKISNHNAGVAGLCLSGGLLVLAVWRAIYHFRSNNFSWTSRRGFHVLFCVAMLVEALSYAELCDLVLLVKDKELSERLGYILLEVVGRSLLEVLTYSVVTALWLETVGRNVGRSMQNMLFLCGTILLSSSMLQAADMVHSEEEVLWIYKLHVFVEAGCWLLHCVAAIACCLLTTRKIVSLSVFPQSDCTTRTKILVKALLPMLLCATSYGVRSMWLYSFEVDSRTPTYSRESLEWWVGFMWVPTLIPSLMLLYSTRKRDIESDSATTPLLSPPGPPAEAFISFQRLNPEAFWSPFSTRSVAGVEPDVINLEHEDVRSVQMGNTPQELMYDEANTTSSQ
jgi:hypothetical protein